MRKPEQGSGFIEACIRSASQSNSVGIKAAPDICPQVTTLNDTEITDRICRFETLKVSLHRYLCDIPSDNGMHIMSTQPRSDSTIHLSTCIVASFTPYWPNRDLSQSQVKQRNPGTMQLQKMRASVQGYVGTNSRVASSPAANKRTDIGKTGSEENMTEQSRLGRTLRMKSQENKMSKNHKKKKKKTLSPPLTLLVPPHRYSHSR
ncbi:uncharacterized protein H6S33_008457 [Morchella sextelata]|uniref:uncharacterized protein n=1 Tax=Morchella sextelata TaxID=1174677 RepID=UPI001D05B178|nr:uncharacterized protein H6S33_008457 [Morchella sextelata]KAH0602807.1 hypothetical protein H6S33_008457 [Morchella sextelata]